MWRLRRSSAPERVDPEQLYGITPDGPVPYWGWGALPDQYGRRFRDCVLASSVATAPDRRFENVPERCAADWLSAEINLLPAVHHEPSDWLVRRRNPFSIPQVRPDIPRGPAGRSFTNVSFAGTAMTLVPGRLVERLIAFDKEGGSSPEPRVS